jgi:cation:H+ antiporter
VLIGAVLLVGGIALVAWGAERFTDGAVRTASRFTLSTFFVGAVASGFEPENLVTGVAAALGQLSQIALGTVIGSAVFMLTAGLGLTVLLVPLEVRIPRAGAVAMMLTAVPFAVALWNDGTVSRVEGCGLLAAAVGLMTWLYRRSPIFRGTSVANGDHAPAAEHSSAGKAVGLLVLGVGVMVVGADLVVRGVRTLLASVMLSETFLGMAVVGIGESIEEMARMATPARRGHPELALGNVVGTVVGLLLFNQGVIALAGPLVADPLVWRFHAPYLVACVLLVALGLLWARTLGRGFGLVLVGLFLAYVTINLMYMWR